MRSFREIALLLAFLLAGTPGYGEEPEDRKTIAPALADRAFLDLEGKEIRPLRPAEGAKARVVVFATVDCPIANAYQPKLQRLASKYRKAGIPFVLVQVDPDVDQATAKAHAREYRIEMPVIRDPDHLLVEGTGVTITPEAVLVDEEGAILYRGRIDDWYTDLGQRRAAVRSHDLRNALDAVLAGKPVPRSRTKAIGCIIADFRKPAKPAPPSDRAGTSPGK